MRKGYVKFRRGILNHTEDGRMTVTEYAVYSAMLLAADSATGIWIGSGRALAFLFNCTLSERAAQRALYSLERNPEGAYIKRFTRPGSHGNYPILINRFDVTQGARMGMRLNADATTDWREPVYCAPEIVGEDVVEDMVEDGVQDVSPIGELRIENINPPGRPKARVVRPVSGTATLPIFESAKECAYRTWRKKFGSDPSWGPKDFSQLARLLRRQRNLSIEEFCARWDRYLQDREPFIAKQGYSLAFFCSRFDSYIERPALDFPLATPYEG